MIKNIKLMLKGFLIGVANIIPGVSGGTLAITLGIYEQLIGAISHLFSKLKENILFLLPIGIGGILSILLLSHLINYTLEHFPLATTLFFLGLILGGIPLLVKKTKKEKKKPLYFIFTIIGFAIVILLSLLKQDGTSVDLSTLTLGSYLMLFVIGIIAAATMVIPGISGSFMLMLLGYYHPIISSISNLTDKALMMQSIKVLVPFGVGIIIGILLIAKLLEFLFKKFEVPTYYGILGFILASAIAIATPLFHLVPSIIEVIIGIILFILGAGVAYKLGGE